jgi:hypothetical protein
VRKSCALAICNTGDSPPSCRNDSLIPRLFVTGLLEIVRYMCTMRNTPIFVIFAVFLVILAPAHAQTTLQITESDCSQLVTHVASSDVSYRPGVDVNGNAVAPADLNAQPQIAVPDVISIPVTIDLATNLGINTPFLARPTVGEVQTTRDGRVTFNCQPIGGSAQQELAKRCQQIGVTN